MTDLQATIVAVGAILIITIVSATFIVVADLRRILEELAYANRDKRDDEYHAKHPNLPRY